MVIEERYKSISTPERPKDIFSLEGRVGVIVGGAGKMAQQFAKTLGYAGASMMLADLPDARSMESAKIISDLTGAEVLGVDCDVSDPEQVKELFETASDRFGHLDFFIYSVLSKPEGYYRTTHQYALETWNHALAGNLTGAFFCSREAFNHMNPNKGGTMVLVSSIYGMVGPDQRIYEDCSPVDNVYGGTDPLCCPAVYSASKSGIIGLTRYFAALWGASNIRVNAMTPGGVFDGQDTSFREAYEHRTPLKRMAVWADFSGAVLFLVSDASRYMTGANLIIDGGWTAW